MFPPSVFKHRAQGERSKSQRTNVGITVSTSAGLLERNCQRKIAFHRKDKRRMMLLPTNCSWTAFSLRIDPWQAELLFCLQNSQQKYHVTSHTCSEFESSRSIGLVPTPHGWSTHMPWIQRVETHWACLQHNPPYQTHTRSRNCQGFPAKRNFAQTKFLQRKQNMSGHYPNCSTPPEVARSALGFLEWPLQGARGRCLLIPETSDWINLQLSSIQGIQLCWAGKTTEAHIFHCAPPKYERISKR